MSAYNNVVELLCSNLGISADKIQPESKIVEDLGADSIDIFEMIIALEDEAGIVIDEDKIADLKTVQDVVNLIENN